VSAPTDFGGYGVHPAAALFPLMNGEELGALAMDIKENGLKEAIVVIDGMILDGRNRFLACRRAGVPACSRCSSSTGTASSARTSRR
jgi:hypothetical protein